MKTMKNFAAQQLTKKQMNEVKGGMGVGECRGADYNIECTIADRDGITRRLYGCASSNGMAIMNVAKEAVKHGASINNDNCTFF